MTLEPCINLRTLGECVTGVQRYVLGLLPYMPATLNSVKPSQALHGIKGHLWEQFYLPTQLKRRLLWSPGNTGPLGVSRQVVTVHDAATLDHPEWFERKFALWYGALLPRLIRKVRAVITVSHFSKERIVQLTGVEPGKVHVVLNGVDPRFRPVDPDKVRQTTADLGLNHPYILFVGSIEPRKNLKTLLEAWRLSRFDGVTLAVAGASSHVFQRSQFDSLPAGVRLLGRVEDDSLPALYSGAAGFVYPSIYEGFGLPPLEAPHCERYVVKQLSILIRSVRRIFRAGWNGSCSLAVRNETPWQNKGQSARLNIAGRPLRRRLGIYLRTARTGRRSFLTPAAPPQRTKFAYVIACCPFVESSPAGVSSQSARALRSGASY